MNSSSRPEGQKWFSNLPADTFGVTAWKGVGLTFCSEVAVGVTESGTHRLLFGDLPGLPKGSKSRLRFKVTHAISSVQIRLRSHRLSKAWWSLLDARRSERSPLKYLRSLPCVTQGLNRNTLSQEYDGLFSLYLFPHQPFGEETMDDARNASQKQRWRRSNFRRFNLS